MYAYNMYPSSACGATICFEPWPVTLKVVVQQKHFLNILISSLNVKNGAHTSLLMLDAYPLQNDVWQHMEVFAHIIQLFVGSVKLLTGDKDYGKCFNGM